MKKICIIILVATISLMMMLAGCGRYQKNFSDAPKKSEDVVLNSTAIVRAREEGNYYYYADASEGDRLYQMNVKTLERKLLYDGKVSSVYPYQDKVFFINVSKESKQSDDSLSIYSVDKTGKNVKKLVSNCDRIFMIKDDIIYYATIDPVFYLHTYNLKTGKVNQLTNYETDSLTAVSSELYFLTYGAKQTNGDELELFTAISTTSFNQPFENTKQIYEAQHLFNLTYDDGKLYFIEVTPDANQKSTYQIMSLELSTGKAEKIMSLESEDMDSQKNQRRYYNNMYVQNGMIYCSYSVSDLNGTILTSEILTKDISTGKTGKLAQNEHFQIVWFTKSGIFGSSNIFSDENSTGKIFDYSGKVIVPKK